MYAIRSYYERQENPAGQPGPEADTQRRLEAGAEIDPGTGLLHLVETEKTQFLGEQRLHALRHGRKKTDFTGHP